MVTTFIDVHGEPHLLFEAVASGSGHADGWDSGESGVKKVATKRDYFRKLTPQAGLAAESLTYTAAFSDRF